MMVLAFEKARQTYPVLSEVNRRKAPLSDLLASSEFADNLIRRLLWVRRRWWAAADSSGRRPRCSHGRCDRGLRRLYLLMSCAFLYQLLQFVLFK